jgi:hypothetical protein
LSIAHIFSMGFKSGLLAGQSRTWGTLMDKYSALQKVSGHPFFDIQFFDHNSTK